MKRGQTDAETCALNGWGVGTLVRGHEQWETGGVWTTWRITAIGETSVLVRTVRSEYTGAFSNRPVKTRVGDEHTSTFRYRDWTTAPPERETEPEQETEAAEAVDGQVGA